MDTEKAGGWLWYSAGHWSEAACDCDVIMEEGAAAAAAAAALYRLPAVQHLWFSSFRSLKHLYDQI